MANVRLLTTVPHSVPEYAWDVLLKFELPIKDSSPEYYTINLYPVIRDMERTLDADNKRAAREWKNFAINNRGELKLHRSYCTPV